MAEHYPTSEPLLKDATDRKRAGQLVNGLLEAFPWRETPQGESYWEQVVANLRDLAGEFSDE